MSEKQELQQPPHEVPVLQPGDEIHLQAAFDGQGRAEYAKLADFLKDEYAKLGVFVFAITPGDETRVVAVIRPPLAPADGRHRRWARRRPFRVGHCPETATHCKQWGKCSLYGCALVELAKVTDDDPDPGSWSSGAPLSIDRAQFGGSMNRCEAYRPGNEEVRCIEHPTHEGPHWDGKAAFWPRSASRCAGTEGIPCCLDDGHDTVHFDPLLRGWWWYS